MRKLPYILFDPQWNEDSPMANLGVAIHEARACGGTVRDAETGAILYPPASGTLLGEVMPDGDDG